MYNQLEQIYQQKKKIISKRTQVNSNVLVKAYEGLIKQKSVTEIHRDIRRILIRADCYDKYVENYVRKVVKKGKRLKNTEEIDLLFTDMLYAGLNSIVYKQAREKEGKQKEEIIEKMVDKNRWDVTHKVFDGEDKILSAKIIYLASSHLDSALDHKDYQGKMYVDKNWEMLLKDYPKTKALVKQFIEKKNIKTFQWVIGKPVWFITRPNCRHYFKPITLEQALDNSESALLKKFNMLHATGYENMKPIKTDGKGVYTRENIENIIKKYKQRLYFHEGLYKVNPTDLMKGYIDKDKLLIKKWQSYLNKKGV